MATTHTGIEEPTLSDLLVPGEALVYPMKYAHGFAVFVII